MFKAVLQQLEGQLQGMKQINQLREHEECQGHGKLRKFTQSVSALSEVDVEEPPHPHKRLYPVANAQGSF